MTPEEELRYIWETGAGRLPLGKMITAAKIRHGFATIILFSPSSAYKVSQWDPYGRELNHPAYHPSLERAISAYMALLAEMGGVV